MSQDETWIGTLWAVKLEENQTMEDRAAEILAKLGCVFEDDLYETCIEQIRCESYDDFIVLDGVIYETDMKCKEDPYGTEFKLEEDGSLKFMTSFYNGGADINEVLEADIPLEVRSQIKEK